VILAVDVKTDNFSIKTFELAPPIDAAASSGSGWLAPHLLPSPASIRRVSLSKGDVLILPGGWKHRVVTKGLTMTVNWGYHCQESEPTSDPTDFD
jgi:hypothetical protein